MTTMKDKKQRGEILNKRAENTLYSLSADMLMLKEQCEIKEKYLCEAVDADTHDKILL